MAFFKKIFGGKEPEKPKDFRSKRGGKRVAKPVPDIPEIPLDEGKPSPARAAPPRARAPQRPTKRTPAPPAAKPSASPVSPRAPTAQMRAPVRPSPARVAPRAPGPTTRRTVRIAGKGTPIGQILLEAGKITTEQLTKALQVHEKKGGLLGQILRRMNACEEIDVANALQKQFRVTSISLRGVGFKPQTLALVAKEACLAHRLIPIEQLGPMLCLAMANVLNRKVITEIEGRTKLKVKALRCPWPEIQKVLEKIYTDKVEAMAQSGDVLEKATQAAQVAAEEEKKTAVEAVAEAEQAAKKAEEAAAKRAEAAARKQQLDRYKKKASALYQIADAAFASGALGDAKRRLEEAIDLVPDYGEAKELLEKVEKDFVEKQAEEEKLRTAEEEKRRKMARHFEEAEKARSEGEFKKAKESLRKVFEIEPGHARAAAMIASMEEDERGRERDEGKRARIETLAGEAREAREKGDLETAKARLSEALEIDPENAAVREGLSSVSEAQATLVAEEARKKTQAERRSRIASAIAAAKESRSEGELEHAKVKLEDALAVDPENEEATRLLVEVQEEMRAREAEAAAKRRLGAMVEEARGVVSSDPEKAQRIVEQILALDPENAEAASFKGDIAVRMVELEELRAKEEEFRGEIERLMMEVQTARATDQLGVAADKLREVMALDPDNLDAMALLAAVEDEIREREEVTELAAEERERREGERKREEEEKRAKLDGLFAEAKTFFDAGELAPARAKLKEALGLDSLHASARALLPRVEKDLARRKEEEERLARLGALLDEARELKERDELEAASLKVREVLETDAGHAGAAALRKEIEEETRKHIQEEARKRAEKERRKNVAALLAEAKEARAMEEMEAARAKLMEALAIAPDDADAEALLASIDAEVREKEEAEARKKAEEEARARAAELVAGAREEFDADLEAARLRVKEALDLVPDLPEARTLLDEIEAEIEAKKVATLSPAERAAREILLLESSLPRFRDQIARAVREKGLAANTPAAALERLPVAEVYARSRAEYISMAEAAAAAEAALAGHPVEEIAVGGEEAELEPPPQPTAPIPAVERALAQLPEVPAIEVGGVAQAVLITEEEFSRLSAEFEPDPVQAWCETYATAGPIVAVLYEE